MNRRKAVINIISFGVTAGIGFSTYKFYNIKKVPELYLLEKYKKLLAELAETIIPATDTPGAKAANVQNFIINVVTNCSSTKEQNNFLNGLEDLENYCNSNYGKSFTGCTLDEKNAVLTYFEGKALYKSDLLNKINSKVFGQPFFVRLKTLTVDGYCNSQIGATQGLAYDYIPGSYHDCISLNKNQRSWATK